MATSPASPYVRSLICATKRLRISSTFVPSTTVPCAQRARHLQTQKLTPAIEEELAQLRLPRAVQATYLAPLKREWKYGITVCDLQLRSYSLRNLEVFADFALRAAYYLNLPAHGPRPLSRIIERWTVPRSNFIFKKSQENFERITLRRLVTIKDGHPDTVALWLAFLQRYRYYGVGLKANVFDWSDTDVTAAMLAQGKEVLDTLDSGFDSERIGEMGGVAAPSPLPGEQGGQFNLARQTERLQEAADLQLFKARFGSYGPMSASAGVPPGNQRFERIKVESEKVKAERLAAEASKTSSSEAEDGLEGEDSSSSNAVAETSEQASEGGKKD